MNINVKNFKSDIPENEVFRHLRIHAPLTTRQMGALLGCNPSLVTHWEVGRQKMPKHRRRQYMDIFKLSTGEMADYQSGSKMIPINYQHECMLLIDKMTPEKLQMIYPVLVNIVG